MNFRDRVAADPWSTALDRCVADQSRTIAEQEWRVSRAAQRRLGPVLWGEVCEYWAAVNENRVWNRSVEFAWERHVKWDSALGQWRGETDEEMRDRQAELKWKVEGGRFVFLGVR